MSSSECGNVEEKHRVVYADRRRRGVGETQDYKVAKAGENGTSSSSTESNGSHDPTWLKTHHRFWIAPFRQSALQHENAVFLLLLFFSKCIHLGECFFPKALLSPDKTDVSAWRTKHRGKRCVFKFIRNNVDVAWDSVRQYSCSLRTLLPRHGGMSCDALLVLNDVYSLLLKVPQKLR